MFDGLQMDEVAFPIVLVDVMQRNIARMQAFAADLKFDVHAARELGPAPTIATRWPEPPRCTCRR